MKQYMMYVLSFKIWPHWRLGRSIDSKVDFSILCVSCCRKNSNATGENRSMALQLAVPEEGDYFM
jgi:hypothetical protein